MNNKFIRLWDVLEEMDRVDSENRPVRFQIKVVSADRNLNTGGEVIELKGCCKCTNDKNKQTPSVARGPAGNPGEKIKKDPLHWNNSTRNLLLANGQKRKVHIRLIIEFNNQTVCY